MNENNLLYSETSERRIELVYSPENNNIKKSEIEKEQFYLLQESKELKENHLKLSYKLEELKSKLKEKSFDVNNFNKK